MRAVLIEPTQLYVTETFAMGMVTAALLAGLVMGWAAERYLGKWMERWFR